MDRVPEVPGCGGRTMCVAGSCPSAGVSAWYLRRHYRKRPLPHPGPPSLLVSQSQNLVPRTPSIQPPRLQPERRRPLQPAGARARAQRWWISLGAALILGPLLYLGVLALLRSAPGRRALRERAVAELATLPAAHLEGMVGVDAAFRLVAGPVVVAPPGAAAILTPGISP